jgi:hypothetical protein
MARMVDHSAQVLARARAGGARGLELAAEHLLQVSRGRVPIEEGTLERSGVASVDEPNLRAAVSFDTDYAVRQHEDLGLRHDDGRTAKYLEQPAAAEHDTMGALLAQAVRNELG